MSRRLIPATLQRAAGQIPALFRWWCGELAQMVGDLADRCGIRPARTVEICLVGEELEVTELRRDIPERTHRWPRASLEDPTEDHWNALPKLALLRVSPGTYWSTVLEFPEAARGDLRSALSLRIDRLSPAPLEQLYWTFTVLGEPNHDKQFQVGVTFLHRSPVDSLVRVLGERQIDVGAIAPLPQEAVQFRIVPQTSRQSAARLVQWLNAGLTVLALLIAISVGIVWQLRSASEQTWLETAGAAAQAAAAADLELRARLEKEQRTASAIAARVIRPSNLQLLELLQARLPPPIWLQALMLSADQARLTLYVPPKIDVRNLLLGAPGVRSVTETTRVSMGEGGVGEERVELLLDLRSGDSS